ncbi:hypothetical protein UlMin_037219 [Ulmus minor]
MAEEGEEEVREKEPETEGFAMCRKEKRKASKKMKRKQARKEMAVKEREEEEARINDPEEQIRIKLREQEEAERSERARKEFEERERAWLEAMETKRKMEEEEEEQRRKAQDDESQRQQDENANESDENDDWEYVEEGPAEIIWQGNEIIVKKKRVRVPKKKKVDQLSRKEDTDRPTSNPLPPDSEAFADNQNSFLSAQDAIESVAQQVPNFGTEQDKAHCPFHLKTGACRFGQRCSRVHFYPDKACTLLIKNMYTGPGLAWEQDEGLEYTDEEVEHYYEEFYEDVHTEFLKFGEIVNFKVCRNGSFHLRGNVYVHFKSLDSAVLAHHSINGRYFAGKQVRCEFVNVTRWKVAICGEYMKSRFKSCSRGTACNFIHCFRNPGGDYEWADSDKPPPTYWVKKMGALFGYSDESAYERQSSSSKTSTADADRYWSNRSRSRERDYLRYSSSGRRKDTEDYVRRREDRERCRSDEKEQIRTPDEESEESMDLKDNDRRRKTGYTDIDRKSFDDRDRDRDSHHNKTSRRSRWHSGDSKNKTHESDSDGETHHSHSRKSSKNHKRDEDRRDKDRVRETYDRSIKSSSRYRSDIDRECSDKDNDYDSELYYGEVHKEHPSECEEVTQKHQKSKRKFSCSHRDRSENESRSRGSRKSKHRRHSNSPKESE